MTLTVTRMSGFATIQDAGRPGYRAEGVPLCGAMDVASLALANALVGNPSDAAAIEWALAGGSILFSARTLAAVAGADVQLARSGAPVSSHVTLEFAAGDELTVERFVRGAYVYVAVRGRIAVPTVLGSRSTYLPAAFGGLDGRRLRAGDVLRVGEPTENERVVLSEARSGSLDDTAKPIRAIEGPNTAAFSREFRESFWASEFAVTSSSNRTGYRLEREPHADPEGRSAASEPACVGAIQVPSGAGAIVLMADGPTVGGYPKIGVVASVDIPVLAQRMPGDLVRFERITTEDAQRLLREKRSLAEPGSRA